MTAAIESFGTTPDGEEVALVTLRGGPATARVMTWGASLQDFRLDGVAHALVLGSPDFAAYLGPLRYYGATCGRVVNRIEGARTTLDGVELLLEGWEDGAPILHAGSQGASDRNWTLEEAEDSRARFSLTMPDGQGGFPGTLHLSLVYALDEDGALRIEITGQTDAPTFCNIAHHSYWNLDGAPDISDHRLWIAAETYLPTSPVNIPTGERAPVAGTGFDFRTPAPLPPISNQLIDHNFCIDDWDGTLRPVGRLEAGGLALEVETTEPGLQVFDGVILDSGPFATHSGRPYGRHAGLALEPQHWPDAPNKPDFPSIVLRPGETYRQTSLFRPVRQP